MTTNLSPAERIAALKAKAQAAGIVVASPAAKVVEQPKPAPTAQPTKTASQILQEKLAAKAAQARVMQNTEIVPASPPAAPEVKPILGSEQLEQDKPDLCNSIRELNAALIEQEDGILFWLTKVHEQLRGNPELVHMLTDDQQAAIYQSMIAQSRVQIIAPKASKAKAPKTPKIAAGSASLDDM